MKPLVIIPTYNEHENIGKVIPAILESVPQADILVVDDNSQDGTTEIIKAIGLSTGRVFLISREKKLGLGTAYVVGFKWALLQGNYDPVFEMDADLSHDPEALCHFLNEIEAADLIIGSRYTDGVNVVNWPMKRLLLSYFANWYARIVTGVPVRDLTSGFKCYRRSVLEAIDLDKIHSNGYAFQIEMHFKAFRKGFRIREIPIVFVERRTGTSKMSRKIVYEAAWMVWKLRLLSLLGKL
jgi:dolichol-phosphate mannosyltransferase